MKANELRIGNWIKYNSFELGGFYQVEQICKDSQGFEGCYIRFRNDSFSTSLEEDEDESEQLMIEPIPLTEEWLLKFGFEKSNINYQDKFLIGGFMFALRISKTGCVCDTGSNHLDTFKILYVHQLQNLYFALTGEELKLKDE